MSTQPLFDRESFDEAWPALAERLRRSLTARGVPAQDRDDVVQETALRVYRAWPTLDSTRSTWPFVITVAINFWRDIIRERTGRIAEVHPTAHIEVTADQDVERDVLARQELANTVVAIRSLAPEQRRLLLATEEFADTERPLRPAERVARMRVRRQLARTVGRASAALFLIWLRRPGRSGGMVATAYAGALAAAVLTSPAMVTTPLVTAMPASPHAVLQHQQPPAAVAAGSAGHQRGQRVAKDAVATPVAAVTAQRDAGDASSADSGHAPRRTHTKVCAPVTIPAAVASVVVKIGATGIYGSDGGSQPLAATPPVVVRSSSGCVGIG